MGIITEKDIKAKYYTKAEACKLLNVCERTINRIIVNGNIDKLYFKKALYINKKELENYFNNVYISNSRKKSK